jgi:hypothetical protein
MVRLAVVAALALAGCGDIPKMRTEAEIRRIAQGVASDYVEPSIINDSNTNDKIIQLERDNAMLERDIKSLNQRLEALDDAHDRLLNILVEYEKSGRI